MTDTIFFRLLDGANRPSRLSGAIEELHEGGEHADVYPVETASLRQVPGSPFAYWVSDAVRAKFAELPSFETEGRTAKRGPSTGDDFRRVRTWWEVAVDEQADDGKWVPFSKGGVYSPYYADVHLLVAWDRTRRTFLDFHGRPGRMTERPESLDYFFRPGLTWPRRTTSRISVRVLPAGCIFADKGPAAFSPNPNRTSLLALMNSHVFAELVALHMGAAATAARSYEVGVIQQTPLPELSKAEDKQLGDSALRCVEIKRNLDTANETSHAFHVPALLQTEGASLRERIERWQDRVLNSEHRLAEHQREIDDIAFRLYGIEGEDRQAIEESLGAGDGAAISAEDDGTPEADDAEEATATPDDGALVAELLSYTVGCVFGRWDARIALDPSLAPKLADPFAPLPVCSPGMLVGTDGLPARKDGIAGEEWMRARPDAITPPGEGAARHPTVPDSGYPLAVDWDGILVDDPSHADDIVLRVREVLGLVWGGRADEVEEEARGLLGVKDLRGFFRNPRRFFDFHVRRYSRSRRKAPIFWLLQSPKRSYGLWLYYHRLGPDLLFKALTKYVEPKIRREEALREELRDRRRSMGEGGREAKQAEKAVEEREALLADLREFRDRLDRAAKLYLHPDPNDGVALNLAPLHELVPWKEPKGKWNELLAGKHEWSSIGRQLRRKGLV